MLRACSEAHRRAEAQTAGERGQKSGEYREGRGCRREGAFCRFEGVFLFSKSWEPYVDAWRRYMQDMHAKCTRMPRRRHMQPCAQADRCCSKVRAHVQEWQKARHKPILQAILQRVRRTATS